MKKFGKNTYKKVGVVNVSSLGKAVLSVLQGDIWTWVREPRIYVKDNMAYIHAVKLDRLNLLYILKKENTDWKTVNIQ